MKESWLQTDYSIIQKQHGLPDMSTAGCTSDNILFQIRQIQSPNTTTPGGRFNWTQTTINMMALGNSTTTLFNVIMSDAPDLMSFLGYNANVTKLVARIMQAATPPYTEGTAGVIKA